MTGREQLEYMEARTRLYVSAGGRCEVCGAVLPDGVYGPWHIAHRIPQNKMNLRAYGRRIIHHPLNTAAVCGHRCNDMVSKSNHPVFERELVARIEADLEGDKSNANT